jgi:LmbE family N-acetylglucosaminyl deacetylase
VLVICAHPDDEVLGCGGTILKHVAAGDAVSWLIATAAHEPAWTPEVIAAKRQEIERVAGMYGVEAVHALGLPTTRLDHLSFGDIVDTMRPAFAKARPATVYVVNPGDVHTDHAVVFQAAWTLMKTFRAATAGPTRVLAYETLSSTDAAPPLLGRVFVPTAFSDISAFMDRKLAIAAEYASEMQPEPHPRSASAIRALGRVRGATIGVEYAEAFMLLRDVF